jgi:hypothetical protein
MTTIFKAVPGQPEVNISYLDDSIRFIGNDVKTINIERVQYGKTLIIDEADSLREINIRNSGATISFNEFPKQTIRIRGAFEEVRVQDKNDHYNLHRFASNPTLPLGNVWGAIITTEHDIECEQMDALMIKPEEVAELEIDGEWSHISVIGDKHLTDIKVKGKRVISNFVVHKGPALQSINIRRRVLSCSLMRCPFVNTIIGFGDRLSIQPKPRKKNTLSIGGFWHQVPEWYDLQVALLQIPHFKAHLTAADILGCEDLGGITIMPYRYHGPGGLCQFASALKIEDEQLTFGIEIKTLIDLTEENPDAGFQILGEWCSDNLSLFDQYKAMRVLAALISRGFDAKSVIGLRNRLSEMNTSMPKLIIGTVNDGDQGGKWNAMYSGNSDEWEIPNNSVMPFGRVDLEIWLNTNLGMEFLGMKPILTNYQARVSRRRHLGENSVVRNLLISTLSAANTVGRGNPAERKLSELAESLYTNPIINTDPFCCEFTIYHISISRIATKPIIRQLIDGIASMQTAPWKKVALLAGIIDQTNSPHARMVMKRLAADKDFTISESSTINAISVAGKRAFDSGKAAKPEWPYLKSWQKHNKR